MVSGREIPSLFGMRHASTAGDRVELVFMVIGFAFFFLPKTYAIGSTAYNVWRVVVVLVSFVALLLYLRNVEPSLRWVLFILFLLSYYCISTIMNHSDGSRGRLVFYLVEIGGFVTLLEYGLSRDRDTCLRAFLVAGVVMCAAHYLTYMLYRQYSYGMDFSRSTNYGDLTISPFFLLTHDNGSVFYFVPVLGALWYYAFEKGRNFWLPVSASALTLYMYWDLMTTTALIVTAGSVLLFLIIWVADCMTLRKLLSYKRSLFVGVAFCVVVLLLYSTDFFSLVSTSLGKSEDLGRGYIWQSAIQSIASSPFFGVGFEADSTTVTKLGINHCHNILVQILYTGGMLATALFAASMLLCDIPRSQRSEMLSKGQAVLCITVVAVFVASTFDWYLYMAVQFLPFVLYRYSMPKYARAEDGATCIKGETHGFWTAGDGGGDATSSAGLSVRRGMMA